MTAYYNEFDAYAAQWLRNLIEAGHIAPGDVDERSIADVRPADLAGYDQCHFFAGIGIWSAALRAAGWPDDEQVWTGSCPCQPFSVAGGGKGTEDDRHLWPEFFRLIRECRPHVVFGEQVSGTSGRAWLDVVQADMEGEAYAFGAAVTCACGFGAPHMRQRLYFVADASSSRGGAGLCDCGPAAIGRPEPTDSSSPSLVADAGCKQHQRWGGLRDTDGAPLRATVARKGGCGGGEVQGGQRALDEPTDGSAGSGVAQGDTERKGSQGHAGNVERGDEPGRDDAQSGRSASETGLPVNGFWRDAEWIPCRPEPRYPEGSWRPVESGSFPLAHGAPARVGRLRAYGNGLCLAQASEFIAAYMGVAE